MTSKADGLIGAYGQFWDASWVDWTPGHGNTWQLLGRRGSNRPGLRVVDVRRARGVYILYNDHGAYYAGLAKGVAGIGGRLKDHMDGTDRHKGKWQRFSWFSFDLVSARPDHISGLHQMVKRSKYVPSDDAFVVRELEALLINVLGVQLQNQMKFQTAHRWEQVGAGEEADWYLGKVAPGYGGAR